ncbi:MAG: nucleoside-triphosphatase [Bacteroidales bacterium]|nr:nucleoside-triphosphatase [Bacteroidales bacterium]MDD3665907.1 nucleoside-triphosphatase [Bacteroidales bacterium]
MIHFIAGEQGSGKSSLMYKIFDEALSRGITCGGFIAKGFWRQDSRSGFDLHLLASGRVLPFCRDEEMPGWIKLRRFYFSATTLAAGKEEMTKSLNNPPDLWLIDEIGPIDLSGELWHDTFRTLVASEPCKLVVSVRPALVEEVTHFFNIKNKNVHLLAETTATEILATVFQG